MTTMLAFFSTAGLIIALGGFLKYYIDAKIDPIQSQMKQLLDYMVLHQGKISMLEERTKKLS